MTKPQLTAVDFFAARLAFQTDVTDVHRALDTGDPGFVLVDVRSAAGWEQARIPGAIQLPTDDIAARAAGLIPAGTAVVTYCWGPGCNGATRAALEFAKRGYPVREMLGGIEYWIREGLEVAGPAGRVRTAPDPLTAPASGISCAC